MCSAACTDSISSVELGTGTNGEFGEVGVRRLQTAAVINRDREVARNVARERHHAWCRRPDPGRLGGGDVHAPMSGVAPNRRKGGDDASRDRPRQTDTATRLGAPLRPAGQREQHEDEEPHDSGPGPRNRLLSACGHGSTSASRQVESIRRTIATEGVWSAPELRGRSGGALAGRRQPRMLCTERTPRAAMRLRTSWRNTFG